MERTERTAEPTDLPTDLPADAPWQDATRTPAERARALGLLDEVSEDEVAEAMKEHDAGVKYGITGGERVVDLQGVQRVLPLPTQGVPPTAEAPLGDADSDGRHEQEVGDDDDQA